MSVCVYSVCCVVLYVGSSPATDRSPVQGVPLTVLITKLKKQPRSTRAVEPKMDGWMDVTGET
jgi:hypothetical protein